MSEVVVGVSALDCESAVTILVDGHPVWAASEERFTRTKQQAGFPHRSLKEGLAYASLAPEDIDVVAHSFLDRQGETKEQLRNLKESFRDELRASSAIPKRAYHLYRYARSTANAAVRLLPRYDRELVDGLREYGLQDRLEYYPHHLTHAESCFRTSGWERALVVVMDGYGTGECSTIWLAEMEELRKLVSVRSPHSLGNFYSSATEALGFTPNRHEGKVLGLAAHGTTDGIRPRILERFVVGDGDYAIQSMLYGDLEARRLAKTHAREDIAATYQSILEDVAVEFVTPYVEKYETPRIVMAGGVMANVKLNQRIAQIRGVEEVWVFPAMADSGTAYGAALCASSRRPSVGRRLEDAFLGPVFDDVEIGRTLKKYGLSPLEVDDLEASIALLLTTGAVVARFDGRMEFGPRALGNRSILVRATDPDTNRTLNERLRRTEFMPFAPATLFEYGDRCYEGLDRGRSSAEFMTMTFDCTDEMRRQSPAAVHVDGTARPQLVRKEQHPGYHRILEEYHRLTGIPSVINTSFNMHEEPIVCTPDDAARAFLDGDLEFLALGCHLIPNPRAPQTLRSLEEVASAMNR